MRVIAGNNSGAILKTISDRKTRPTLGIVREALFNILGDKVVDAELLDLFAGSGSLGIEALSRGAKNVVFIDNNPQCIRIIHKNLNKFDFGVKGSAYVRDAYKIINFFANQNKKFDIILMDPPYRAGKIEKIINNSRLKEILNSKAILVIEHAKRYAPSCSSIEELCHIKSKRYGDTVLAIYEFKS